MKSPSKVCQNNVIKEETLENVNLIWYQIVIAHCKQQQFL